MTFLDFSHNKFESIPIETGNLELLRDLGTWDVGISQLTKLRHIDFSHNKLDSWPAQVDALINLKHINFSHNNLVGIVDASHLIYLSPFTYHTY